MSVMLEFPAIGLVKGKRLPDRKNFPGMLELSVDYQIPSMTEAHDWLEELVYIHNDGNLTTMEIYDMWVVPGETGMRLLLEPVRPWGKHGINGTDMPAPRRASNTWSLIEKLTRMHIVK